MLNFKIKYSKEKLKIDEFHSNNLFKWYDFKNNKIADEVLIFNEDIFKLKRKEISNYDNLKIYYEILKICENFPLDDTSEYNFNIYPYEEDNLRLGGSMIVIAKRLENYWNYVYTIKNNGIISYILFDFLDYDDKNKIK